MYLSASICECSDGIVVICFPSFSYICAKTIHTIISLHGYNKYWAWYVLPLCAGYFMG